MGKTNYFDEEVTDVDGFRRRYKIYRSFPIKTIDRYRRLQIFLSPLKLNLTATINDHFEDVNRTRQSSCVTARGIPPAPPPFWTLTWTLTGGSPDLDLDLELGGPLDLDQGGPGILTWGARGPPTLDRGPPVDRYTK